MKPGFGLCQAWENFVAWIYAIRREGISAEEAQFGRRLYYQLRVAQATKENPGVNIQALANAIGDPRKEDDPIFQAVQKRKNIPPLLLAMRVVFDADAKGTTPQHAMCR
ncbi:hypothetical protein DQ04_13691000 [Trypanosoma grayi]|uniref:hypothetical protein n=1 Tax=Trypanosoma grayi TaxID=71804 RepID=UPI0004F4583B|nr:hypothetical protein DQ04_13691000 [Trypanosoma grayi]KEG06485.1 hypothetical protein DQ04_13691000 [Trypanosoma grayi]